MKRSMRSTMLVVMAATAGVASAQNVPPAAPVTGRPAAAAQFVPQPVAKLGDGPWDLDTKTGKIHVSVVAKDLVTPWALAFLPDGTMLVTERAGRLRVIRKGVLDPKPVAGLPPVLAEGLGGLMDVALHPQFARNHWIYMTYSKGEPKANSTVAVMRARWDGSGTLKDVKDIFVADAWYGAPPLPARCCGQGPSSGSYGSRLVFDRKGYLYFTSGDRNFGELAQVPGTDIGKILRIRDDGSIPRDNPFVGKGDYLPEIWSTGHRNPLGLTIHPVTGALWESEFGPRGGDEVNLIEKGKNYGWFLMTQGNHYNNAPVKLGHKDVAGFQDPVLAWVPSINPGNLLFYSGDKFPQWKGQLLMATMTRSVMRQAFGTDGKPEGEQERFLTELKQRFRDIRQGPDGNIYLLTDEAAGALLKVEPAK